MSEAVEGYERRRGLEERGPTATDLRERALELEQEAIDDEAIGPPPYTDDPGYEQ